MSGLFRRRRLPHLDVPGGTYFVTAALAGSAPARGLARRKVAEFSRVEAWPHAGQPAWLTERCAARERELDLAPVVRWLERDDLARIVEAAIRYGDGKWYDLLAYVVMPSHMHLVFRPFETDGDQDQGAAGADLAHLGPGVVRTPRQRILQSIRCYSARLCNAKLGRSGAFWQRESYDRWLRDENAVRCAAEYVIYNPVAAGLCHDPAKWPYSSASARGS